MTQTQAYLRILASVATKYLVLQRLCVKNKKKKSKVNVSSGLLRWLTA